MQISKEIVTYDVNIYELIPYKNNAKKHDKKQIDQVANSINIFGCKQPLVIDKNKVIIVGHCRYEALKKLNRITVPCVFADTLSEDEVNSYRLADNKLNESEWDMELVNLELEPLDFDLQKLTGFEIGLLEPNNDELIGEFKNKPFSIKCTFKNQEDMENAKVEIEDILKRYEKSFLSISGGEL